jgi:hypothetical protein
MLGAGGSERVTALMRETAAAELLPRFRNLVDDIREKRPGDVVTVADIASEQRLARVSPDPAGRARGGRGGGRARCGVARPDRPAGRAVLDRRSA